MPLRALIVDDDPLALAIGCTILTRRGFDVSSASSAKEASLLDLDVDVLCLDLNMPDFDGIEFLEHLKVRHFRGGLIIVTSAFRSVRQSADVLAKAYDLLLLDVIEKPLTAQKFDSAILHERAMRAS